ncbi:hypothetical protein CMI37_13795 [Candidatus Pacearchaeota archaeon]|nr:hypothetical protein [Candidatus Pacearchaeota archaeon]|tara:strand:- start:2131 stop:2829 length:699 start_codon:yes stop_codon:yes gene_type:complete
MLSIAKPNNNVKEETMEATIIVHPENEEAYQKLSVQIEGLARIAKSRVILTADDLKPATDDLSLIAQLHTELEAYRKSFTQPLLVYKAEIDETFKLLSEPLVEANKVTKQKVLAFRAEEERKRQEAEAINREKQELAERERKLAEEKGEAAPAEPELVDVPLEPTGRIRTDMGLAGQRMVKKWEVEDISQVPAMYLSVEAGKVNKVVKAGGSIPGIRIWEEPTLAVTARRHD